MEYHTIFYICGGVLAALAVTTSFIGLRFKEFPGRLMPLVVLVFVALIGTTITYAVLNGQEEQEARAEEVEPAGEEFEKEESSPVTEEGGAEQGSAKGGGQSTPINGPGGTLQLAASPTDIAYDKTKLSSEPGEVTIDFTNPATLEHDVAIEGEGEVLATSETISGGKTSVTADLGPGTYTFFCTIPGHREAGMEGTLTVK